MNTDELLATTDHKTILEWTRANQGIPVMMKSKNAAGQKEIAIDFSAGSANGDDSIAVTWEEWLRIFDKRKLVLMYNAHAGDESRPDYRLESKQELVSSIGRR
jgi:hypothetical protein